MSDTWKQLPIQIDDVETSGGWHRRVNRNTTVAALLDTWDIDEPTEQSEMAQVLRHLRDQAAEIERLRSKLLDYDNQWSRIAAAVGGDARQAQDGTIAGYVIEQFEELKQRIDGGRCRMLSEGDACDCPLCKRDKEIERLRGEIERQEIFLQLYRSGDFLGDAKMLLVRAAYESGEISGERASELLGESRQVFQERGWMQGDGIEETRAEIERLRTALRQACDLWDADNLTTQTYLKQWKEALGDEEA